ncbi:MAG: glycosyltransferase family 39 protein [Pseudomonadota bacterium]|nr:glycosyltransferase family 39 protein [Pseudomonadota bacterium]
MNPAPPPAAAPAWPLSPPLRSPVAQPLVWLLALCLAHVLVRLAASPALKWDEAEQMLWSQQLAWGYGAQPPLYTWLQWGVNQVLGPSVLALSLLKHSLLALTYIFMWLAGRELLGPRGAWWASASMLLMPALGWHSVRDQTHTILVTAMTCAAWWLLLRLARRPRASDFAWLGAVCAAGLLAKYSFALVMAAMLAAALSVPHTRRALFARGWWWAPVVGTLLVLPHGLWLLAHMQEATTGTLDKMQLRQSLGAGLLSLVSVVLGLLTLWALVALWAFRGAWWRRPLAPAAPWAHTLFVRYVALVLLALLGMVLLAGVSSFKGRWVLPLLCMVPLAAFAARPELQQHPRARHYSGAVVAVALVLLAAAGLRPWLSGWRGDADELNHPIVELAAALRAQGYDGTSPIVAADHMLAGMLRTRFASVRVSACATEENRVADCVAQHVQAAQAAGQGVLLISRQDRPAPDWWAQARAQTPLPPEQALQLPFNKMRAGTPPALYHWVWLPAAPAPAAPALPASSALPDRP